MSQENVEIVRRSLERFLCTGEHSWEIIAWGRGGISLERRDASVHTLRDGKIVRLDYYGDLAEALEAVGLQ
jgi:ketosteroid isomerase-like protein